MIEKYLLKFFGIPWKEGKVRLEVDKICILDDHINLLFLSRIICEKGFMASLNETYLSQRIYGLGPYLFSVHFRNQRNVANRLIFLTFKAK